jgi:uncharacterized protein
MAGQHGAIASTATTQQSFLAQIVDVPGAALGEVADPVHIVEMTITKGACHLMVIALDARTDGPTIHCANHSQFTATPTARHPTIIDHLRHRTRPSRQAVVNETSLMNRACFGAGPHHYGAAMARLAMFPLGSVLLPTGVLPLHVFEPRYRQMINDCLASDAPEFGVVLIARGSEVGGDDVRLPIGTVARIIEVNQFDDGRSAVVAVGVRRCEVIDWLPDNPYPIAEVVDLFDSEPQPELQDLHDANVTLLRRVLALRAELGEPGPPATVELDEDATLAGYQAAVLSPIGDSDSYRLLAAPDSLTRAQLLHDLLADERATCALRLAELSTDGPESWPTPDLDD